MQNGKKIKHLPPALVIKDFKRGKGLTRESLEEIFEGTRKTLRLLVSKAASLYDPTGITSALVGQLRDVVRVATLHTQGQYEKEVPDTMWTHFGDCLYEALMVANHAYPRLTDQNIIEKGLIHLIGSVDGRVLLTNPCLPSQPPKFRGRKVNQSLREQELPLT